MIDLSPAMRRCVFCRSTNSVSRTPAYSKPGRWIRESRVFVVNTCEQDRDAAEQSFDTPFTDQQMINLYKESISND